MHLYFMVICCVKVLHTFFLLHVSIVHFLVYISIATLIIRYIFLSDLSIFMYRMLNSDLYALVYIYTYIYVTRSEKTYHLAQN